MTTRIKVADYGTMLVLRSTGRQVREVVAELADGEQVIFDWAGVEAITGAFGDELCGVLFAMAVDDIRHGRMPHWFVHENWNDEVGETLCLVAMRRIDLIRGQAATAARQDAEAGRPGEVTVMASPFGDALGQFGQGEAAELVRGAREVVVEYRRDDSSRAGPGWAATSPQIDGFLVHAARLEIAQERARSELAAWLDPAVVVREVQVDEP